MEPLRQRDLRRMLAFLRESYALRDLDGFVAYLIGGVADLVRSDFTSYTAFSPGRLVTQISRPSGVATAETDGLWERYMHESPLVTHHRGSGDGRAVKMSDFVSQRQFHRTGLYNELHRRLGGIERQMAFTFPAPRPLVIGLGLNRCGATDFSERDRLLVNLLRPHLIQAHRNAAAVSRMRGDLALLLTGAEGGGRGIAILASDGRPRLVSARARAWLQKYFGASPRSSDRLPDAMDRWVEHQLAGLGGEDTVPAARAPLAMERAGSRLTVRLVAGSGGYVLLMEERRTALEPKTLEAFGLSRREAEVLACVAQGLTNETAGSLLGISRRTVQKHLERVFQKLGVETRTSAAARALELAQHPPHDDDHSA